MKTLAELTQQALAQGEPIEADHVEELSMMFQEELNEINGNETNKTN
jgi:hypothetical protein